MNSRLHRPHSRSIALLGFMAAGKSRIGRLLADRLGLQFADTDALIVERFKMSVADIFGQHGEAAFRKAEAELIQELLSGEQRVIALGGGLFVDEANRALLKRRASTVWIDPPFEKLLPRIRRSTARPLAMRMTDEQLRSLWEERRAAYAEANIRIATSDEPPERAVDVILEALTSG